MPIQLKNIRKTFGSYVALKDISLDINTGELLALLGPSGSGKTTLLRIIAGLDIPDSGSITIDGRNAHGLDIRTRNVGFVFQHYALFRHMTVFENVAFGLRVRPRNRRPDETTIRNRVLELLSLLHLEGFDQRYPSQLSGGQRQRVALARALAVEPTVLLLDEPFGALDAKVRRELRRWIRRLHEDIHITQIFVTHDQEEAMEVADRVAVLNNGHIEQIGTPGEVYHHPANSFVYDFLGHYNEIEGWKDEQGAIVFIDNGQRPLNGRPVKVFARPHEMTLSRVPQPGETVLARVIHINPAGSLVKLELERQDGMVLQAEISQEQLKELQIKPKDTLHVGAKTTRVFE